MRNPPFSCCLTRVLSQLLAHPAALHGSAGGGLLLGQGLVVGGQTVVENGHVQIFQGVRTYRKNFKNVNGYKVYTAKTDGFGSIENNAEQLKSHILKILELEQTDKVNLIAHSKGGLDSKYMINQLNFAEHVASLTTLCTPHKGSPIATKLLRLPKFLIKITAFWVNLIYKIFGDKHPDALKVCKQLQLSEQDCNAYAPTDVYCQSYSTALEKCRERFYNEHTSHFFETRGKSPYRRARFRRIV